jgi:putative transposase
VVGNQVTDPFSAQWPIFGRIARPSRANLVRSRNEVPGLPKFRRLVVPGYPHHVTQRGVRRQTTFFEAGDYRAYLSLAVELLKDSDLRIYAYCLMPNHMHAVVVPGDEISMSRYFATLHRRYAKRTNALHGWKGHLWQERFYSVPMNSAHTFSAMRYVELNPVRSGLVGSAEDWPWSSAMGNLGLRRDPLIDRDSLRHLVTDWRSYLAEKPRAEELDGIRNQTKTGRPAGDAQFIGKLEALTGRRIQPKRPGPKPKAGRHGQR